MEFEVIRSDRRTMAAEIKRNKLIVRAPRWATDDDVDRFLRHNEKWIEKHLSKAWAREKAREGVRKLLPDEIDALAKSARKTIPERVAHYAPLVGVSYGRIAIRRQRSRWDSCSSKGNLNFNCLLMLAPPGVLDSVVVHELCHRKEMNHSKKFYAEVLRVFPDYWEQHKWLKENGDVIMAMLDE